MRGLGLGFAAIVLLDQLSKAWVVQRLGLFESISILPGILHLTHVQNPGAAFGLLPYQRPLFVAVTAALIAFVWLYRDRIRQEARPVRLAVCLGLAGATGNLIDRLRTGYVIDFLDVPWIPVFNVADMAIVAAAILMAWGLLRSEGGGAA